MTHITDILQQGENENVVFKTSFPKFVTETLLTFANAKVGLYGIFTIDDLLSGNYKSRARTKMIAFAFKSVGWIERYGSGITRVIRICKEYGIVTPEFKIESGGFVVTIFNEKLNKVSDNLSKNQNKILELIAENDKISMQQMANSIGISKRKILDNINKLKELQHLERIGTPKNGYWQIIKK